jgi:DNA-directed RNA polymerase subunit RPC12/RpoP
VPWPGCSVSVDRFLPTDVRARYRPAPGDGHPKARGPRQKEQCGDGVIDVGNAGRTGSFRCEECGYVVTLAAADALPACPGCSSRSFARASLFSGPRFARGSADERTPEERSTWVDEARESIEAPGQYLVFERDGTTESIALEREWTRVGRSLAADVRFDDPTVSRRHALIVRQPDGVRVLDDRSLNGVFVNGERVEWRELGDGDEIVVGRYRLTFLDAGSQAVGLSDPSLEAAG